MNRDLSKSLWTRARRKKGIEIFLWSWIKIVNKIWNEFSRSRFVIFQFQVASFSLCERNIMFFVRLGLFTFFLVCYELIWSSTSFSTGNNGKRESTQKPLLRPRVWGSPAEGRHPCYRSNLRPWRVMVFVDERWRGNQPQFGSYSRVNKISYTLRIVHIRALPKQIDTAAIKLFNPSLLNAT